MLHSLCSREAQNFNNDLLRGVLRRQLDLDIVRVQDAGLAGTDDPTVLEWAARERRVLLSHDVSTLTRFAYERVEAGQSMSGLFELGRTVRLRQAIDDILLLAECGAEGEFEGQVRYLPL